METAAQPNLLEGQVQSNPTDAHSSLASPQQEPTTEQLQGMVTAELKKRETDCSEAIGAILKQYKCDLIPIVNITGNQVNATISLKARPLF